MVSPSNRGQVVQFIRPMENNGISVDLIKIEVDAIFQLLLGSNTNPPQHLLGHLTKETFNQIQMLNQYFVEYDLLLLSFKLP